MTTGSGLLHTGSPQQLIVCYEALLKRCQQMLDWARRNEWEALIEEEALYVLDVERLAIFSAAIPLEGGFHERRMDLVERILETSLEIQHYLVQRRDALGQMLGGALRLRSPDSSGYAASPADFGAGQEW